MVADAHNLERKAHGVAVCVVPSSGFSVCASRILFVQVTVGVRGTERVVF